MSNGAVYIETSLITQLAEYKNPTGWDKYLLFFSKAENAFIDEEIDSAKKKFIQKIPPLEYMLNMIFDKWPYNQPIDNYQILLKPVFIRDTHHTKVTPQQWKEWEVLFEEITGYLNDIATEYDFFQNDCKT